jgi:hypothetical protein
MAVAAQNHTLIGEMEGGVRADATAHLVCRQQHLFFETDIMITNSSSSIPTAMVIQLSSNRDPAASLRQLCCSSSFHHPRQQPCGIISKIYSEPSSTTCNSRRLPIYVLEDPDA